MGKDKLRKFAEIKTLPNVLEPGMDESFNVDYRLKGRWKQDFFKNDKPIVLELGCGKGEYTVEMAKQFPENNYIGIDIKGARIWRGAKSAIEENLSNVAFLRTRIEWFGSFFSTDEIAEIWITFPDPQLKESRTMKRLTSSVFLNMYNTALIQEGKIHLKTDSFELYQYTNKLLKLNSIKPILNISDIYSDDSIPEILRVKTHYEKIYLTEGKKITYLQFKLDKSKKYVEP